MTRRRAVSCLLVSLLAVAAASCGGEAGNDATFERADAKKLVLGPRDLGRGYTYGDDSFCGGFSPESMSEEFTDFVRETNPVGCGAELQYVFGSGRTTGVARGVTSGAVVFDDPADARRGLELRDDLIRFVTAESPRGFSDVPDLGDEAVAFQNAGFDVTPGAGVLWRNGNMLAVLFAGGTGIGREKAQEIAMALARKQQMRIENPAPAVETTEDDRDLELDDPELEIPVYWLGKEFDPPGDLPSLELYKGRSYPGGGRAELGFSADLDYEGGVTLNLWQPAAWERAKRGLPGRLVWADGCTRSTELRLPKGRAVVYAGYAKPSEPPCPGRPPDRFLAHAYLGGVLVRVNPVLCLYPCGARPTGPRDPYNSREGMEAVLRGLRLR